MKKIKFEFANSNAEILSGLLELPETALEPVSFALFAHCFTCGKDNAAATRISRALAAQGIAVLRFDFTGLGNSDGDFSNSNFSSNIEDLLYAAKELEKQFQAPELIIGHSLGGAAALAVATRLPSIKAVVTIASPATAHHLTDLFSAQSNQIKTQGVASLRLGNRDFTVKKQFLDDIDQYQSTDQIKNLDAALLVLHSPADAIVSIDEATKIFQSAKHPKSFVSLDQADHLLSKSADAKYVATIIASWSTRYLNQNRIKEIEPAVQIEAGEILVTELNKKFLRGLRSDSHFLLSDEPEKYGGGNQGAGPYDLLLMALGACTSMTLRMYANRKNMPLDDIEVRLKHHRVHAEDCDDCEKNIDEISRSITLVGALDEEQRQRLLEIADHCPVHRTLENNPRIVTELI
ncbi:MAG: putative OsmC-like protein/pimeloyl-ACP methyl ester carboxylesterase [Gammaproteobacteria bacterium]|jgi:uncharacterized OsmC-like protein/pimeloyl-ACP methyl ester carboxylesterase